MNQSCLLNCWDFSRDNGELLGFWSDVKVRQWMEQEKNAVLQKAGNLETGCMAAKECPKIHCLEAEK